MKRTPLEPIFLVGKMGFVILSLLFTLPIKTQAAAPSDLAQVGLAFITSVAVHESGHAFIADQVGNAESVRMNFFTMKNSSFALGVTEVKNLDKDSKVPFIMGGEIANSYNFEYALLSYRRQPTTYNRALMFFSGTDFLWYTMYSLYLSQGASYHDPVGLKRETGLSEQAILGIALTQSLLNLHRVTSGKDTIVPYFTFDHSSVNFMVKMSVW